jgi:hypothetical protein
LDWLHPVIHKPLIAWLQKQILDWKHQRRVGNPDDPELWQVAVIVPRKCGKTVAATKAASLWSHLDEPNMTTSIGSEVKDLAADFLKPIKQTIAGLNPYAWFTWLYGNWFDATRTWNKYEIEHGYKRATGLSEPSYDTFGVDTGVTGYHPLQIWWDDPLTINKLREGTGKYLPQVIQAFNASFPAIRADGFLAMVLTRYLDADVAGEAFKADGIKSWDGLDSSDPRYTRSSPEVGKGAWRVYYLQGRDTHNTVNYQEGEPLFPRVWSHRAMLAYENRDPIEFSAQIMNDPATGEHMPLTREQIENMLIERDACPPIEYATIHLDTAFKTPDRRGKGDLSVISVWLHDLRNTGIVVFDGAKVSKDWRVEEFNSALVGTLIDLRRRNIRVRAITDETEIGGKAETWKTLVTQAIEGARLRVPEIILLPRGPQAKANRIRAAAGFWVEGYVRLIKDAENIYMLKHEMARIGYVAPDDLSDASADVFSKKADVWRRPLYQGPDDDEGSYPMQPGDNVLRGNRGWHMTDEDVRKLYDEQHPKEDEGLQPYEPRRPFG